VPLSTLRLPPPERAETSTFSAAASKMPPISTKCQKRLRSEAFRSLVKDSCVATYGGATLKEYPSQKAVFKAAKRDFEATKARELRESDKPAATMQTLQRMAKSSKTTSLIP
jgi:hypothetical protein